MIMIKWQGHMFMDPCCAVKLVRHVWITNRCAWDLLVSIWQKRNTFSRMALHRSTFREKKHLQIEKRKTWERRILFLINYLLVRQKYIASINLVWMAISTTKTMYKYDPECRRLHWDLKVNQWKWHDVWQKIMMIQMKCKNQYFYFLLNLNLLT